MSGGASSWAFREDDSRRITDILRTFLSESSARTAMIVDRTGQLVSTVGEPPTFDPTAFASLTAADFSANDQLARMLGEPEFGALFHQGERESMYLADVARRVILVVLFDNRTTLGLVKLRVKAAVGQLNQVFTDMFNRDGTSAPGVESAFLGETVFAGQALVEGDGLGTDTEDAAIVTAIRLAKVSAPDALSAAVGCS